MATHYGSGTGAIFLSSVQCKGTETNLLDCQHSTIHECPHMYDVGLKCEGIYI